MDKHHQIPDNSGIIRLSTAEPMSAPLHIVLASTANTVRDATLDTLLLEIAHAHKIIIVCGKDLNKGTKAGCQLDSTGAGVSEFAGIPTFSSKPDNFFGIRPTKPASLKDLFDISALKDGTSDSLPRAASHSRHPRKNFACVHAEHRRAGEEAKLSLGLPILDESLDDTAQEGHIVISPTTGIARCIPLHGSCELCIVTYVATRVPCIFFTITKATRTSFCPGCKAKSDERVARGQRALRIPKLRPSVVLYNEEHPDSQAITAVICRDLDELGSYAVHQPCMLLVAGTSLQIPGTRSLVKEFASVLRGSAKNRIILVNLTFPSGQFCKKIFDVWVEGDAQEFSQCLDAKLSTPRAWRDGVRQVPVVAEGVGVGVREKSLSGDVEQTKSPGEGRLSAPLLRGRTPPSKGCRRLTSNAASEARPRSSPTSALNRAAHAPLDSFVKRADCTSAISFSVGSAVRDSLLALTKLGFIRGAPAPRLRYDSEGVRGRDFSVGKRASSGCY
ncbi:DHS-like NAD/FAD-binding domain-containing protein [Mycena vitilis]|nr:DHS-like NAD/FAD-binding domain-containing protein [Mycena vitilis]